MIILIQMTVKLEQEVRQFQERENERQRIHELETTVTTLLQRLNMIEQEWDFYRPREAPQASNSGSNNQAEQPGEAQVGQEAVPMETEENSQRSAGIQDELNIDTAH